MRTKICSGSKAVEKAAKIWNTRTDIADELAAALDVAGKQIETVFVSLGFPPEMSATKRTIDAALAKYRTET